MDTTNHSHLRILEIPLSMLMLVILLFFTYGILLYAPYIGLYFDPANGQILEFYVPDHSALQTGDMIEKVGSVSFTEYSEDPALPLFSHEMKRGDIIPIEIKRGGIDTTVNWVIPGFNLVEFRGRLINIWWLAYIFWLFGAAVELFIHPRQTRWWLLFTVNHLTGIWLIAGSFSSTNLLGGSLLFHAITWLFLPLYLHLNWIFPKPFFRLPKIWVSLFYSAAILMFLSELVQALPANLFFLALVVALVGSLILQAAHFILRPEQRREIGLLAIATLLAILPAISIGILGSFGSIPPYAPAALFALPFMPLAYLYLIFRSQLGGLEARAHRFISAVAFLIIVGTVLILIIWFAASLPTETSTILAFVTSLTASVISLKVYPNFQTFVEKNFLGVKLPYQNLQEVYSSHIVTSTSTDNLLQLLREEVFPSLLIRQYAFMQVTNGLLKVLLAVNIPSNQLPSEDGMNKLIARAGTYIPKLSSNGDWLRLILPLKVGDAYLGFWLLGQRDPDDIYHQVEIPIFQSIANQTAIALSNILRAEQLRNFYQTDIENIENERNRISRDLHDEVLNQLAAMRNSLDQKTLPPNFLYAYEYLKRRLREIINDLHPPMLDQGLSFAIQEFVDAFREKNPKVNIILDIESGEERIPAKTEEHLFHIVHEACENALRHAEAHTITISGKIFSERVDLSIRDDGKGFEANGEINSLIANHHFGMRNMKERALILEAEMNIQSQRGAGTIIHIIWQPKS